MLQQRTPAPAARPSAVGPGRQPKIGVVGGVERMESHYQSIARESGGQLEFHSGHMSGPGVGRLRALIERVDLLVIVTDVNSHSAVIKARSIARQSGRRVHLTRRFGTAQLRALLAA